MQKETEIKMRILEEFKYKQLKYIQNYIQVYTGCLESEAQTQVSVIQGLLYQHCDLGKFLNLSVSQLPQVKARNTLCKVVG